MLKGHRGRREAGQSERRPGEMVEEGWEERWDLSDIFNIPYTLSYTFICLYMSSNALKYLYIPSYTLIYFKISNIRKMRINIRHTNGHNSGPRASPRVRI